MRRLSAPAPQALVLLPLLLISSALGCEPPADAAENSASTTGVKEREVPLVRTAAIETRDMVRVLEATSKLESDRAVLLFPELPGTAVEILVEEGDYVRQGQVLARLDRRDEELSKRDSEVALKEAKDSYAVAELAIEEATSQLENAAQSARQAERDYDRDESLSRNITGINPLSAQAVEAKLLERDQRRNAEDLAKITLRRRAVELESARTSIERAEVALERAELTLQKKEIRAPFDGVISERKIRVGKSVGTAEAAFILTDTINVRAMFMRPQEELGLFSDLGVDGTDSTQRRLSLEATAEAYPGRNFQGWIERISPTIEADSGQFRVIARIRPVPGEENASAKLLPGMLIRMRIITDRHDGALAIPKRALRREGDRRFVLVVEPDGDDMILREADVAEGYEDEEFVEILPRTGVKLSAGDRIVAVGTRELENGDPVRVDDPGARVQTLKTDRDPASDDSGSKAAPDDATPSDG